MMAPEREYGQQAFELPGRQPPRGRPAPVYSERMRQRREQVAREAERARRLSAARARRGWVLCAVLAAGLMVLCGMRIYQSAVATANARDITRLKSEIHEMTMDLETYEYRIAEAASDKNVEAGAKRLGMEYPSDGQVRVIGG